MSSMHWFCLRKERTSSAQLSTHGKYGLQQYFLFRVRTFLSGVCHDGGVFYFKILHRRPSTPLRACASVSRSRATTDALCESVILQWLPKRPLKEQEMKSNPVDHNQVHCADRRGSGPSGASYVTSIWSSLLLVFS